MSDSILKAAMSVMLYDAQALAERCQSSGKSCALHDITGLGLQRAIEACPHNYACKNVRATHWRLVITPNA